MITAEFRDAKCFKVHGRDVPAEVRTDQLQMSAEPVAKKHSVGKRLTLEGSPLTAWENLN